VNKEASQTRDYCIAKSAMLRAARPGSSLRKERLLGMTNRRERLLGMTNRRERLLGRQTGGSAFGMTSKLDRNFTWNALDRNT
jgi:hypothetical protein